MPTKDTEAGRKACREAARRALDAVLKDPRTETEKEGRTLPVGKGEPG